MRHEGEGLGERPAGATTPGRLKTGEACGILVTLCGQHPLESWKTQQFSDKFRIRDTERKGQMRLANKVAIITDAATGIGRATALLFAREGASVIAEPAFLAYCAAKGGGSALTRVMALDYGRYGIRVNAFLPGYIDHLMNDEYFAAQPDPEGARRSAGAPYALGPLGQPEEKANCALFLASDESLFVTGSCLVADGALSVIVNPAPWFGA